LSPYWAASLNESPFYTLLWQIGELGMRVNPSSDEQGTQYSLPALDPAPSREGLMWKALHVLLALERGRAINVQEARKQVLGEAV
jgi:hypothetical protein